MNFDFTSLDYTLDRFNLFGRDKFTFVENILTITEEGLSNSIIRKYCDMTEGVYDQDAVTTYFLLLADKIDIVV
ncbi:MAG: hypothetical protein H0T62_05235 [Parachlamydiaceae bacterium]|nr:hypothetical protein [Parachlamydiaceae bacterium]